MRNAAKRASFRLKRGALLCGAARKWWSFDRFHESCVTEEIGCKKTVVIYEKKKDQRKYVIDTMNVHKIFAECVSNFEARAQSVWNFAKKNDSFKQKQRCAIVDCIDGEKNKKGDRAV